MSESVRNRVDQLNAMIQQGQIMEAMNEFYTDDLVMGENNNEPTIGLAVNLEREQAFVDNTTWYGLELKSVAVGDDVSMVEWWMDFHNTQYGGRVRCPQLAVPPWVGGEGNGDRVRYT
ncbi:MAG: hypothetical protein QNL88_06700, partial [Acidobacteriota bacterium]|nr:hypothetical protein [Acidobacteriota bacterium]